MARPNLSAAAVIFVVVVVAMAATATASGAHHHRRRVPPPPPPPQQQLDFRVDCTGVHGVIAGETCASVARDAGITLPRFMEMNQNVTCGKLFPGQWVCVESVEVA